VEVDGAEQDQRDQADQHEAQPSIEHLGQRPTMPDCLTAMAGRSGHLGPQHDVAVAERQDRVDAPQPGVTDDGQLLPADP
jgi:hypothetical protein